MAKLLMIDNYDSPTTSFAASLSPWLWGVEPAPSV